MADIISWTLAVSCWWSLHLLLCFTILMDIAVTEKNIGLPSHLSIADPRVHKGKGKHHKLPTGRHPHLGIPLPPRQMTTRLPEFVDVDAPRPNIPDPTFLRTVQEVVVRKGDVASLPCTVQNLGTKQVSWKRVGGEHFISIGTDVWVQDENLDIIHYEWPAGVSDWNLVFSQARISDTGEYVCEIISTDKQARVVSLKVKELPPHNPVISIEGKEFVESGQTVYLRCNMTEGDGVPPTADWFKNGDKIDSSSFPNVLVTEYKLKETRSLISELIIEDGHSSDSGTYICRSSSKLIASMDVNVLVADSSNVKRGTGTSNTQKGIGENVGTTSNYLPLLFTHSFLLCFVFAAYVLINFLTT